MKMTLDIPEIMRCAVSECAFNSEDHCHAGAITVGDVHYPHCDTFMPSSSHRNDDTMAGVSACKVTSCTHNDEFACSADAIRVGMSSDEPTCLTYEAA